ncbi:glycosyltransferase family 2 protein [Nodularia spumigena CS-584]|uniref:UDP-Glc:alpha-D-GlcNAc-diphosphoundecaprenol beta-1,3-glucosyltransferase WfgD n=2 Tax=Nodularia spumigena TaxID=70799 RepID=A0A2S0Q8B6_NODSP|nr:glycosyltransferase family 2 protein [Nodularia spumigena]AHJ29380.1 Glycosyltransferase PglI [Nodularia spumigena CCY9414]AVZ30608.1 UDP-Glc:alpha-D-GlcNAc-diphosphoundecaprenol beta-1,3-glucosyltransferase WfgD [Nodularia spumigena UHCC 0039]MDB9381119.1 glycosyltransferase family 2 protein [Nodularia spumigena CS-584]MEA5525337.1 glycosyltransferase family 2 protein [Nodularia spumigena UHCC 0143]MEA5555914.1 glycosyltransferase family 2 protein [Nodularia spumigena CH309]
MSLTMKSPQPLVSVIIPTYNRPEYLHQAIASAVKQTYQNIEIIVSDNCSPESPQEIVESFGDPRIRFWRQPQNVGMIANQMYGFKMATGKYVASLHDDDMWNQDFLAKLVPPLEANSDLILAFCDQYIIDNNNKIQKEKTEVNTRSYKRDQLAPGVHQPFAKIGLIDKSIATAAACVIRNHTIDWDSIPSEVGGMWDLYLTYLCCISGHSVYYHPEKLTLYREHEQTDTNQSGSRNVQAKIRKAKSEIFCYKIFREDPNIAEFKTHFQKKMLESHTTLGIGLLRNKQTELGRCYLWQALREQKFNLRTIVALILSFTPKMLSNQLLGIPE